MKKILLFLVITNLSIIIYGSESLSGQKIEKEDTNNAHGSVKAGRNRNAQIVRMDPPVFDEKLLKIHKKGKIQIVFIVEENGSVTIEKVDNCPCDEFLVAILMKSRNWQFNPAIKDGKIVRSRISVPISYEYSGK